MTNSSPPNVRVSEASSTFSRLLSETLGRVSSSSQTTIGSLREVERGGSVGVVLCVDLTEQVLAEAIQAHAQHIISYSPSPPQPLATLSVDDPMGRICLKCAQASVAVHSLEGQGAASGQIASATDWLSAALDLERAGDYFESSRALPISTLVARLKEVLDVRHLRLALGVVVDETNLAKALESCFVQTVALHFGGEDAARALHDCTANVIITSEMAHKDVLAANARGVAVLVAGQSTMERAFLRHLREQLQDEFSDSDWNVKVKCSQVDRNPLAVV